MKIYFPNCEYMELFKNVSPCIRTKEWKYNLGKEKAFWIKKSFEWSEFELLDGVSV